LCHPGQPGIAWRTYTCQSWLPDGSGGAYKGKRIETRQKKLAEFLRRRLGPPEVYKNGYAAWRAIRPRHGIISFYRLNGNWDNQGHIDLVEPATMNDLQCASACYWSSAEVWFWPLN
jgi:hypothetical protein